MALVSGLTGDQSKIDLLEKSIKIRDRYGSPRMDRKDVVWRKRNYNTFIDNSPLSSVALLWDVQGDDTKALWDTAGAACGLTGYQLFVQDVSFRMANGMTPLHTPNPFYQYKVLSVELPVAYDESYIWQPHYDIYHVKTPVTGKKDMYYWAEIQETMASPFAVSFDALMNITGGEDEDIFYVYLYFEGIKDGNNSQDLFYLDVPRQQGWYHFEQEITPDLDEINYYEYGIYSLDTYGSYKFDNFNVQHSGQSWGVDPSFSRSDDKILDYGDGPEYPWIVWYNNVAPVIEVVYLDS